MKRTLTVSAIALTATCLQANQPYDIDKLAKIVATNNPAYNIELANNKAELQQLQSENNLEDPEVEFSHLWGSRGAGNKLGIQISQSFAWPGSYKARRDANRATARALDYQAVSNQSELMLQIKQSMLDAVNAYKKMQLYGDALDVVDSLSAIVQKNVTSKEVSVLDGNKIKIERIGLVRKHRDAVNAYNVAFDKIVELGGGKSVDNLREMLTDYPSAPNLRPLETYKEEAAMYNPQLTYQSLLSDASEANLKAIKREALPGFSVGVRHELEGGDRFNGFSVAMSLPFLSNKGKRAAATYTQQALSMTKNQIEVTEQMRITSEYNNAERLSAEINDYRAVIDNAENLRLLKKAFDMRHISVQDYLSDLIYFTDAQADYLDMIYNLQLQVASLDRYSWIISN